MGARPPPAARDRRVGDHASHAGEIFDSLDDGDFQISRAEYVRLMVTRGVSAYEANATFSDMDHTGSNLMTVAKMQHYAYTKSIELISDQFKEIDMQDGSRDRQLTGKDVRFYLLGAGLSKKQAQDVWDQLDENRNGKVSYAEFKAWAHDRLADVAVDDINLAARADVDAGQAQAAAAATITY